MTATLLKTPLNDIHIALGARMVGFAGWNMPIQYTGVIEEHEAVRRHAGLFDLTHMAEFEVKGEDRDRFVQEMTTNDTSRLKVGQALYSCLCGHDGGILDDLLIYRWEESYWIVANASNRAKVWSWLAEHARGRQVLLGDLTMHTALIALQGPAAESILEPHVDGLKLAELDFYHAAHGTLLGHPAVVSRTGYTGEDGFELYLDYGFAEEVWNGLLASDPALKPIGLGARDTLRLESGYALYGNELNESRTPYDVSLAWITKTETDPPPLVAEALRSARERATTCLVGLEMEGRNVPRAGYPVHAQGRQVGEVTSGSFSPSLKKGVALAVVERAARAVGTDVEILVRGKPQPARVVALPFVRGSVKRHS
jgi:aminomethyltransferase